MALYHAFFVKEEAETSPNKPAADPIPEYIFVIFLLSSWAREKVTSTIMNKITIKFFSDKIDFMAASDWVQISNKYYTKKYLNRSIFSTKAS